MRTIRLLLLWPSLLLAACLRPLPQPEVLPCPSARLADFWNCVERTKPSRVDCDPGADARCYRLESSFRSTTRVHFQDVVTLRKWREQRPSTSCTLDPPPGFVARTVDIDGRRTYGFVHPPAGGAHPFVIISYGLYDSTASRYVRLIGEALAADGFGVVIPDLPWHGCSLRDDPRFLSTLGTTEAAQLVAWAKSIRTSHPSSPVALLGFSLGAQNVICALSSPDAGAVFDRGIAVSPPGDLERTMERLDTAGSFRRDGMTRVVRFFFRSNLAGRLRLLGLEPQARPFSQYLDSVAASEHRPAAALIDGIAPEKRLALVRRPLLLIVSADDPAFAGSAPRSLEAAASSNPYTYVLETPFGGHIGHMGVAPKWFASLLSTFFSGSLQE